MTEATKTKYHREQIAQFVEWINDDVARWPERHRSLTPEDREMWAAFPAQVRAHPCEWVVMDPHLPVIDYLKTGRIRPYATWPKATPNVNTGDQHAS